MCGSRLDAEAQANACRGCPLRTLTKSCRLGLVRCPYCGYHSLAHEAQPNAEIEEAPMIRAVKVFESGHSGRVSRLNELLPGTEARLISFNGLRDHDLKRLLAYGLAPGVRVHVIQSSPAVVLKVHETELALEEELAESIEVVAEDGNGKARGSTR
jgi:Fe2+ transport system protein FeoA/DNA-directed RNA polymerase subunit RPC12/RpoP